MWHRILPEEDIETARDDGSNANTLDFDYFSDAKTFSLFAVRTISSLLSIFGSVMIMRLVVLKMRQKGGRGEQHLNHSSPGGTGIRSDSFRGSVGEGGGSCWRFIVSWGSVGLLDRLVFGLSLTDTIVSSGVLLQPFAVPEDTDMKLAFGNTQTCEIDTFFTLFFFGSSIYNAEMSVYFLMSIRYGKTDENLSKIMEPVVHILPFLVPVIYGVIGLGGNMFNPSVVLGVCTYNPYPANCLENESVECERGENSRPYYLPITAFLAFAVSIVCTWLVYWTVHQQTQRNRRHAFNGDLSEVLLKRRRGVAMQAVFFTAAYLNGFIVTTFVLSVMSTYESKTDESNTWSDDGLLFALRMLFDMLYPIQGFFNCIVYIRPRVAQWREAHPAESWMWASGQVFAGRTVPRSLRRRTNATPSPNNKVDLMASLRSRTTNPGTSRTMSSKAAVEGKNEDVEKQVDGSSSKIEDGTSSETLAVNSNKVQNIYGPANEAAVTGVA